MPRGVKADGAAEEAMTDAPAAAEAAPAVLVGASGPVTLSGDAPVTVDVPLDAPIDPPAKVSVIGQHEKAALDMEKVGKHDVAAVLSHIAALFGEMRSFLKAHAHLADHHKLIHDALHGLE